MNPLTALPANARKVIYITYATLGIGFGAVQVGYASAQTDQPGWLFVAFAVFGYLGTALGLVAASNMPSFEDVVEGDVAPSDGDPHPFYVDTPGAGY